jgi:hypothetical protein
MVVPLLPLLKCSGIEGHIPRRNTRITGPTLMIFSGVIGFAPGFLQYKYPLNVASMKGRPEA